MAWWAFGHATPVCAQADSVSRTTKYDEWTPQARPLVDGRSQVKPSVRHKWEELGPMRTPPELSLGGTALPAYSENRGNGTGRINFIYVLPSNKNRVWACSPTGGLWYTRNEGEKWIQGGTDQLPISGCSSVAVNEKKPKQWYIATGDGDDVFIYTNGVWRTRNSGKTWENINGEDPATCLPFGRVNDFGSYISMVAAMPGNFNYLVAATSQGLWVCENAQARKGDIKWKRVASGHFYDVDFVGTKRPVITASGSKLVVSYDSGRTWEEMPLPEYPESEKFKFLRINIEPGTTGSNLLHAAISCSEGNTMSALGEGTYQQFNLSTRQWRHISSLKALANNVITTRGRAFAVNPSDNNQLLCGNVQPVYYSTDGGRSFNKVEKNQMHDDIHHLVFAPGGTHVWAAHDGGVSLSTDGGLHWQLRDNGIGAANVFGLSVAQTKIPQVLYGGYDTGGNLLLNGAWYHTNWGDGLECAIHPTNPDIMFSSSQSGALYKSVGGKNFDEKIGGRNTSSEWHTWVRIDPCNPQTVYSCGSLLVRSRNLGETWEPILNARKTGEHLYNVYRIFLSERHPGTIYAFILDKSKERPELWRTFNADQEDAASITWERVPDPPGMTWTASVVVDPDNAHDFWILFPINELRGKIFYCQDGQYTDITANMGYAKCESMVLQRGSDKRLYVGSTYGIFTRKKGDNEWTLLTGLPGTFIKSMDINYAARQLVVGTFGRGVWQGDLYDE